MPYKIKINTKKAMTEPIEMSQFSDWLIDWFEVNKNKIIGTIIGLLLLGGVLVGWYFLQKQSNRAALQLEYDASLSFKDALLYEGDENAVREAYLQGVFLLNQLTEQYPNSKSAPLAFFELGNGYFQLEEYIKASETYQDFLKRFGSDHSLSPLVFQKLAYTNLKLDRVSEAETYFEKNATNANAPNRDQSIYELARLYERQGKLDLALSKYQEITKSFPTSPVSSEAQARVKRLSPDQPSPSEANSPPIEIGNEPSTPLSK